MLKKRPTNLTSQQPGVLCLSKFSLNWKVLNPDFKIKKSQSGIEFIILLSAVLFFFTSFFIIISQNMEDKNNEREMTMMGIIANSIQEEINLASEASNGYHRDFIVEETINGVEYDMIVDGNLVNLKTSSNAMAFRIQEVNGTIKKGLNSIKKENGQVSLN